MSLRSGQRNDLNSSSNQRAAFEEKKHLCSIRNHPFRTRGGYQNQLASIHPRVATMLGSIAFRRAFASASGGGGGGGGKKLPPLPKSSEQLYRAPVDSLEGSNPNNLYYQSPEQIRAARAKRRRLAKSFAGEHTLLTIIGLGSTM